MYMHNFYIQSTFFKYMIRTWKGLTANLQIINYRVAIQIMYLWLGGVTTQSSSDHCAAKLISSCIMAPVSITYLHGIGLKWARSTTHTTGTHTDLSSNLKLD
jgi:hypothetical protein